jgi:hypothetical protein
MRRVIVLLSAATLGSLAMAARLPMPPSDAERPVQTRGTGHALSRLAASRSRHRKPAHPTLANGAEAGAGASRRVDRGH